jgi:hypothetical protein
MQHDTSAEGSSSMSFTAIKLNSKTIADRGNLLEYYMKPLLQTEKK